MKKILCALLLMLPIGAFADHIDVIEMQLNEGCSLSTFLAIKDDFNEQWGKKYSYQVEVLTPIQSNNLTSLFWSGRSENAAVFGKAYDQWTTDLMDPDSVASKLVARFEECTDLLGRRGYIVH